MASICSPTVAAPVRSLSAISRERAGTGAQARGHSSTASAAAIPVLASPRLISRCHLVSIMAPAALLSSGPVQSLCPACSATKKWQPKRLVSSGSALTRTSPHANMDKASVKSLISLRPLDSVFGRRRRSGLGPETRRCSSRHVFTAAVEGSIAVEETESAASASVSESSEENIEESVPAAAAPPPPKAERFKPRIPGQKARREDVTVPDEALVEGAVFTGKVTTIQSFGAFVNFGAFTDGLVHISKMSTGYVSNVSDIVTLGQEVKVTILSVEQKSGRIALSMVDKEEKEAAMKEAAAAKAGDSREGSERSRFQQGPDGKPVNRGRVAGGGRQNRRDEPQKPPTKLTKGQEVEGTVKNKIRSGVFVELPENEEGFIRYSDIPGGENMAPETSLQTGEKIKATVLRIDRGKIVLTMKPIVDISSVNRDINQGKDSGATNPFEIAFRAFNLIPAEPAGPVEEDVLEKEIASPEAAVSVEELISEAASVVEEAIAEVTAAVEESPVVEEVIAEVTAAVEESPVVEEVIAEVTAAVEESPVVEEVIAEVTAAVEASPVVEEVIAEVPAAVEESPVEEEKDVVPEAVASAVEVPPAEEEVVAEAPASVEDIVSEATSTAVEEEVSNVEEAPAAVEASTAVEIPAESVPETEAAVEEAPVSEEEVAAAPVVQQEVIPAAAAAAPPVEEPVAERAQAKVTPALVKQLRDETGAGMMDCKRALADTGGDIEKARETLRKKGLASAEKKASRIASEGLIGSYIQEDSRIGVLLEVNCETDFVSRGPVFKSLVEDLGMQVVASQQVLFVSLEDIPAEVEDKEKLALLEQPYFRDDKILVKDLVKQTVATLGENIKARRFERYVLGEASEGLIGSYIHDGRIGILIEVNCETDIVARGEKFKELVEDLAMQIAAYPLVQVVSVDDVPAEEVAKEKELESGKEDLANKPEAIRARIVDGRVAKRLAELALLEQSFIKNDKKLVKAVVKEAVASLGENIQVRRFTRFNLGEGIVKKVVDFASEVAAQSGRKA